MYKQNVKNQAVKEVKNGSTAAAVARKFDIPPATIGKWVNEYEKKRYEIIRDDDVKAAPVVTPAGIKLQSIRVVISGAVVTLTLNNVLKLLKLFDVLNEGDVEE